MRLFFALLPDAPMRDRLEIVAAKLRLAGRSRTVTPTNLHITLAFIGDVPDTNLGMFREMGSLGLHRLAFDLDVLEYWPKSQATVLAARQNPPELEAKTIQLRTAVAARVHPRQEKKPWRAHVTLARKVAQAPVLTEILPLAWVSQAFSLMSSKIGADESVYTVVDSWPLLDKA